jgi:MYXO-CTERM domain-containing protein
MTHGFKAALRRGVVAFVGLVLFHTSQAALVGRDIHGQAVAATAPQAVFIYDDVANLTWLRDFAAGGSLTSADAHAGVDQLALGGFTDWRLPINASPLVPGCTVTCSGELTYLWKDVLGNATTGAPFLTGPFVNLGLSNALWIDESATSGFTSVFVLGFGGNLPGLASSSLAFGVVRTGDVLSPITPVPEPSAYLMGLLGVAALALRRRRGVRP